MGKARELSSEVRFAIVILHEREIASKLKFSKACVHNTITRYRDRDHFQDSPRSGRPRAATSSEDNFIIVTGERNRRLTASEIRVEVNKIRVKPLSLTTVRRRLRNAKFIVASAFENLCYGHKTRKKRMQWAFAH